MSIRYDGSAQKEIFWREFEERSKIRREKLKKAARELGRKHARGEFINSKDANMIDPEVIEQKRNNLTTAKSPFGRGVVISRFSEVDTSIDPEFRNELKHLLNKYSVENASDTPDFILADYLISCLNSYNEVIKTRTRWYTKEPT